ncbi:MAG TPA: methyltransferase [Verrucomicrobiae bacterium]|nr:methyltransferase [Verrucomicrobiae bacterium]
MDFAGLTSLAGGYAEARAVQAAVELGIFDSLETPRDAAGVADTVKADPRATELLLDALVAIGLLNKTLSLYSLNEASATYLIQRSPKYLGGMIRFDASSWNSWGQLAETVRSGKPARSPDMYQNRREETERFIAAMDSLVRARGDAAVVVGKIDLSRVKRLLDVGSGPATYPIEFCRRHPQLQATVFDLPATLAVTETFVRAAGLGDRIRLVAGDYRTENIPGGHDIAFLSNIIHGEAAEVNARLIAKLHGALVEGGRIVIKDHILNEAHTHPASGAVFALLMLLTTERGKCYSFTEVQGWLESAGFHDVHEVPLPAPLTSSLVIGTK